MKKSKERGHTSKQRAHWRLSGDERVVAGLRAQLVHHDIDAAAAHRTMRSSAVTSCGAAQEAAELQHVEHAQRVTTIRNGTDGDRERRTAVSRAVITAESFGR